MKVSSRRRETERVSDEGVREISNQRREEKKRGFSILCWNCEIEIAV
jgi:hypothetical protein